MPHAPSALLPRAGMNRGWEQSLVDAARALTPTPTPSPSPQGGGEPTEIVAPSSTTYDETRGFDVLRSAFTERLGGAAEYVVIPALALAAALVAFGVFVALFGKDPIDLYFYMYQGAFGTAFSWQNTLTRAAPLI